MSKRTLSEEQLKIKRAKRQERRRAKRVQNSNITHSNHQNTREKSNIEINVEYLKIDNINNINSATEFRISKNISIHESLQLIQDNHLYLNFKIDKEFMIDVIKSFTSDIQNSKSFNNLNADFVFEKEKVAIDINCIIDDYNSQKDKNYSFNQYLKWNENNFRYISVFDDFIIDKQKFNVLKNVVLHSLKKSQNRIYARNCEIEEQPALSMKPFFEENNIQGYRHAKTAFVLKYNNEPVMCYTVGFAHFGKGKYDAEIARGACKLGYSVIGGASKLWKYIIEYYNTRNLDNSEGKLNSIVYYVDQNFYSSESIGFLEGIEFIGRKPGFWNYWLDSKRLKNREPKRHKEIMQLMSEGKLIEVRNAGVCVNVWKRK